MCMNPLHFMQTKFLHGEKIMKNASKPTSKYITRYKDYAQQKMYNGKKYDSPIYVGVTITELSKLHMFDAFYDILQSSVKDLQLHYMDTDSFVLSFSEGKVDDMHLVSSNLDIPIKTKNKVLEKFELEFGSKIINEFITLSTKTYSF